MTGDDLARLGARLDEAISAKHDAIRRKDAPWLIEDLRDAVRRRADAYIDAVVLAHTARKPRRGAPEAEA